MCSNVALLAHAATVHFEVWIPWKAHGQTTYKLHMKLNSFNPF